MISDDMWCKRMRRDLLDWYHHCLYAIKGELTLNAGPINISVESR